MSILLMLRAVNTLKKFGRNLSFQAPEEILEREIRQCDEISKMFHLPPAPILYEYSTGIYKQ